MENASKALIIAGGVLIAILVTSVLVVGWNKITAYKKAEEETMTQEQLSNFNKEFESYNKKIVRGYELISLFHLAEDTNRKYSEDDGYKEVEVHVKFRSDTTAVTQVGDVTKQNRLTVGYIDFSEFDSDYLDVYGADYKKIFKESYFQCDGTIYDGEKDTIAGRGTEEPNGGSGRIQKLYFSQIKRVNDE